MRPRHPCSSWCSYLVDRANLLLFVDLGAQRQRLLSLQVGACSPEKQCLGVGTDCVPPGMRCLTEHHCTPTS